MDRLDELTSIRHESTKTQYAYSESGGVVSYDGTYTSFVLSYFVVALISPHFTPLHQILDEEAICDKTEYCVEHNLNGYIIWEICKDLNLVYI